MNPEPEYDDFGVAISGTMEPSGVKFQCARCEEYYSRGSKFCGACGNRLTPPEKTADVDLFGKIGRALMVLVALVLVFELSYMALRSVAVFDALATFKSNLFFMLPLPHTVAVLSGAALQYYWVLVVAILFACGILLLWDLYTIWKKRTADPSAVEKTGLYWVSLLLAASLFVQIAISVIGMALGNPVDSSWLDNYTNDQLLFMMTEAAVWEEFVTRVCIIGIPVALLTLIKTRDIKSLRFVAGRFDMSKVAFALLILSSVIFGLAHYDGWGLTKIFMTTLGGIIEGYLFIRFGLHASIGMHFINNSLSMFMWAGLAVPMLFVEILLMGLGAVVALLLVMRGFKTKGWKDSFMALPMIAKK